MKLSSIISLTRKTASKRAYFYSGTGSKNKPSFYVLYLCLCMFVCYARQFPVSVFSAFLPVSCTFSLAFEVKFVMKNFSQMLFHIFFIPRLFLQWFYNRAPLIRTQGVGWYEQGPHLQVFVSGDYIHTYIHTYILYYIASPWGLFRHTYTN